eukprot:gene2936-4775_t
MKQEEKRELDEKIKIYEQKTREVVKIIENKELKSVDKIVNKSYDDLVTEISLLLLKYYHEETKCFYDLPLKITAKIITSRKSKGFPTVLNDHWIIQNEGNLFVAWKQDSSYFEVHYLNSDNTTTDKDGFNPTLNRVLELHSKIYLARDLREFKVEKLHNIHINFI